MPFLLGHYTLFRVKNQWCAPPFAGLFPRTDRRERQRAQNSLDFGIIQQVNLLPDKERTNDMTIADVVKVLDGKLMAGDGASPRAVGAVVANDLMSDVLLYDADDILLLTSLASDQAIRTAHIVGAMGVVIHNAKPLSQTMIEVANNLGVPLVSSPLAKYEACVRIHDALTQEK